MTRAAQRLHISQPSLSKQMKELETELGKKLFVRSNYSIHLTKEGMLPRKRAEDPLAQAVGRLNRRYPGIHYHITSGDTEQVTEKLNRGLFDMAFIVEPPDLSRYNYLEVPETDTWGAIMRKDCPLAEKDSVTIDDLLPYPIFCSEQSAKSDLPRWCGEKADHLNIMATFNLSNNGAVFVKEGLGICLTFDRLIETTPDSSICFRPVTPVLHTKMYVIWKKYQVFTAVSKLLLEEITKIISPA